VTCVLLDVGPRLGRCKCHGRKACVNGMFAARTVTVVTQRARQTRGFLQGKQFQVTWASSLLQARLMLFRLRRRALGGELQAAYRSRSSERGGSWPPVSADAAGDALSRIGEACKGHRRARGCGARVRATTIGERPASAREAAVLRSRASCRAFGCPTPLRASFFVGKFIVGGRAHAFQVLCCAVAAHGELACVGRRTPTGSSASPYRAHGALRGGAVQRLLQHDFLSKLHNSKTHTSDGEHPSATPRARRWQGRWKQREDVKARAGQIAGQVARTPSFPHSLGSKPLADSRVSECGWASRPQQRTLFFMCTDPEAQTGKRRRKMCHARPAVWKFDSSCWAAAWISHCFVHPCFAQHSPATHIERLLAGSA